MLRTRINVTRYQLANTLGFLLVIAINAMANILPINGFNTGEISDFYPNLFVPVPLTFSIWLVIYLGLLGFIIYQWGAFSGWTQDHSHTVSRIGWWFFLSCLANAGWIVLWHYLYVELSVLVMGILFLCLLVIYLRLRAADSPSDTERRFAWVPFSIYFGWITVATIANITALLVELDWDRLGMTPESWTVIMIGAALVITLAVLFTKRDMAFSLVVIWTLAGIYMRHSGEFAGQYAQVVTAAMVSAALIGIVMVLMITGILPPPSRVGHYRYL